MCADDTPSNSSSENAHSSHHLVHKSLPKKMTDQSCTSFSSSCSCQVDDFVVDQLTALLQQEAAYRCPDYMSPDFPQKHIAQKTPSQLQFVAECAAIFIDPALHKSLTTSFHPSPTDVRRITNVIQGQAESPPVPKPSDMDHLSPWRCQMCSWAYAACHSFGYDPSTVAVAFSILDRFLATQSIAGQTITREEFQLFTMTCLYMAVKLNEESHAQLSIDSMIDMARGFYSALDFEETELEILAALEWRVNPPTAGRICHLLLDLMGANEFELKNDSLRCCENAVLDSYYVSHSPSDIATSAVLLSARRRGYDESLIMEFCRSIADYIDPMSPECLAVYQYMNSP